MPAILMTFVACGTPTQGRSAPVAAAGPAAPGSGEHAPESAMLMSASKMKGDPDSRFGPLEVGADYLHYRRVTAKPFLSLVHGNRWVHVFVNEIGADAYLRHTRSRSAPSS